MFVCEDVECGDDFSHFLVESLFEANNEAFRNSLKSKTISINVID